MKKLLLFTLLVFLFGCRENAQSSETKGNFSLDLLFEKDGCKMYRFRDGTRDVYWSDCSGRTQSDYRSGKSEYEEETITTE